MAKKRTKRRGNTGVMIMLILAIFLLLAVSAFLIIPSILKGGGEKSQVSASDGAGSAPSEISEDESSAIPDDPKSKAQAEIDSMMAAGVFDSPAFLLVNKDSPLPSDFVPDLKTIPENLRVNPNATEVHAWAYQPMLDMIGAAEQDGIILRVTSSYRSVARQQELFDAKVQEFLSTGFQQEAAETEAAKLVAVPGTSEHATGMALDIVSSDYWSKNDDLYDTFDETAEFGWLSKNAHLYGFILRFPKGAESITGISYEPWHYRFVGANIATAMRELEIGTLEELYGKVNPEEQMPPQGDESLPVDGSGEEESSSGNSTTSG